jgi:radical SAM superfamily enzyme YgiQ (UPF0313 family)
MRVALVNPGVDKYNDTPPINLAMLASYLETKGHNVIIIDKLAGDVFDKKMYEFQPEVVGITATTPVIIDAFRCADYCRRMGVYTVMGGVHSSILPEESLKHADAVVVGEGEIVFAELCESRAKGIFQGKPVMNLDLLPPPAWRLLNMEFYTTVLSRVAINFMAFGDKNMIMGNILTSRGCPWNCMFCHNSYRTVGARYNSAERVIQDLEQLIRDYHITGVFFVEDNFFSNPARVKKICKLMKEHNINIPWGANSRVDCVNDEILAIVKKANCQQVTFGFESGSDRILKVLNKKTTVAMNKKAIQMCNNAGIKASGTFMLGNPTETIKDMEMTRDFIIKNDIRGPIGICITTPYPGTKLWDWCVEHKRIPEGFMWEEFDFHHVPIKVTDIPEDKFMEMNNQIVNIAVRKFYENRKQTISMVGI